MTTPNLEELYFIDAEVITTDKIDRKQTELTDIMLPALTKDKQRKVLMPTTFITDHMIANRVINAVSPHYITSQSDKEYPLLDVVKMFFVREQTCISDKRILNRLSAISDRFELKKITVRNVVKYKMRFVRIPDEYDQDYIQKVYDCVIETFHKDYDDRQLLIHCDRSCVVQRPKFPEYKNMSVEFKEKSNTTTNYEI